MTTATATRRAIGYCRVSTAEQAGERHSSLPEQDQRIQAYCTDHGFAHVGAFTDVASGRRDDRAGYNRMVKHALDGHADVVVVRWLDRFGRNPREILRRVWQLQEAGVEVVATDEDLQQEIVLLVKAWSAGQESRRNAERVMTTMLAAAKKGVHFGRAPYGFKRVVLPTGMVTFDHDPEEVAAIREMARLVTQENLGYKAVADRLSASGFPARSRRGWASEVVRKVLSSPTLVGRMVYGQVPKKGNIGSEVVTIEGYFEAVLTPAEWDAVQQRLAIRRETTPRGRAALSPYLLSGIAQCGHCGAGLIGSMSSRKNRDGTVYHHCAYICANGRRGRALCSDVKYHSAAKLERVILQHLAQYDDPERVRELLAEAEASQAASGVDELQRVEQRLAAIDVDFHRNLDLLKRGILDEEDFARANGDRKTERKALETRLAELRAQVNTGRAREAAVTALPARVRGFLDDVEHLEVRKAKALLQTILQAAHVYRDGRIELEFRAA